MHTPSRCTSHSAYILPLLVTTAFVLPLVVHAQNCSAATIAGILCTIANVAGLAVPVVFALALIFFFWGIAKFIFSAGDTTKVEEGKAVMLWGVVVLFILATVWGILRVLQNTFFGTFS